VRYGSVKEVIHIIYPFHKSLGGNADNIACLQVTIFAVFVVGVNMVQTFASMNVQWFSEHGVCLSLCVCSCLVHY
jgi:hypothetical protein